MTPAWPPLMGYSLRAFPACKMTSWGILGQIALTCSNPPKMAELTMPNQRLDSWKEIAAFFGCDARTVKRWEKERALPVHRLPGVGRGRVFAYSDEMSAWLKGPIPLEGAISPPNPEQIPAPERLSISAPASNHEPNSEAALRPGGRVWKRKILFTIPLLALIAGALLLLLGKHGAKGVGSAPAPRRNAANAEAQNLYLEGRFYWSKRTPTSLNQAVDFFTQSIVHDPSYAPAYSGLADCYNLLREYGAMPDSEAYPRALAAAKRAVELDDTLAEAHASLAFDSFYWNWDAATAEREFRRSNQLDPNNSTAYHWYANVLTALGRPVEALAEIGRARTLDPSSRSILADQAHALFFAGHARQSIDLLHQIETSDPDFVSPHKYLAWIYFSSGDYANSLVESKKTATLLQDSDALAAAEAEEKSFVAAGPTALLQTMLQIEKKRFRENHGSAYAVASASALLGREKEALQYLQIAYARHDSRMTEIKVDSAFQGLHKEAAYRDLQSRVAP